MGTYTFRLPDIGEGIAAAEIVAWHVAVGDRVEEDGRLADMMTDKATVEMESPVAGRIVSLAGAEGDMVAIGAPLVVIETEGEDAAEDAAGPPSAAAPVAHQPAEPVAAPAAPVEMAPAPPAPPPPVAEVAPPAPAPRPEPARDAGHAQMAKVLASPAVRQRARELGIDLGQVRPAEDGRVRHADLDAFLAYNDAYRAPGGARPDQQVKVMGLRRRIAEAMSEAKRNIPHFTYVEECDVTALDEMRAQLNAARGQGEGARPKLTLLPFLIVAMCRTLPRFPMMNARFDDAAGVVTRHGAVHCGVATQTDGGLMVPVIRDAQSRNLWQLANEISRLAAAARNGTAVSSELSGSTITISSLGTLGGIVSTPVINRPEVAILAPNRIVERPMFVPDGMGGERVAKRKLMNLSISCDHRVIDGWDAASFVQDLRRVLETPVLLLAD
ncbi:2-oxo acid dehydrogenase subunit E2 [Novosphingobium flavum]|uniref:dihydrolipoamide acetyltransferase family protein n=1 Tax=Novosphingobium aerophilum TaxID=2839843 RepID=UPI00163A3355|nr:dihydrolipoamide acetyltransferase family protein [Novosphingobium aerophilum]MBC2662473.1 2-oxo acid dehydrogenase subunit E2 [Novosphingobium aerophilum]